MTSFETLIYRQNQLIKSISRALPNFKKLGQAKMTRPVTQYRISLLHDQFSKAQDLDAELSTAADEKLRATHAYFTEDKLATCEGDYYEALDYMHEVIADSEAAGPSASLADNSLIASSTRPVSHLPRLALPTFDGSFANWETFRDRFTSMVIDDQGLSNVNRLHFLCSVLSGDASHAISHLNVTDANFAVAWEIISSRYENKRRLINTHLYALFSLPQIACENSKNLQTLRDQTNMSIQALKNLGRPVHAWDDILVYFVSQKLDKASRKAWELKLSDTVEAPSYSELNTFLESRIRALDAMLPEKPSGTSESNPKSHKSKHIAAHSTTASTFVCPTCKKNHLLYQCTAFLAETPANRHEFIKSHKRCFNCLAATHRTRDCKSERRCRKCSQKHHTLLHLSSDTKTTADEPSTGSAAVKTNNEIEISSHVLSNIESTNSSVLLATARVRVYSPQGRFVHARALLDQGSVATLISENIAQLLRLPRRRQNARITGVGKTHSYAHHAALVRVSPANQREPEYSTNAIILKSLTEYVLDCVSQLHHCPHLAGLPLADTNLMSSDPIDIIIGAEIYSQLILDGVRRGGPDEPLAQNTVFGWILSGPISPSRLPESVHSHHITILDNLDITLRRFWEIESVPQTEYLQTDEKQCEDHFLTNHSRNKHGQYIVRLPFKIGIPVNLGDSRSIALNNLRYLERRLQSDANKAKMYSEFLAEYETLGHMERLSQTPDPKKLYYIPHHAVFRDTSTTSQIRVVFNASSRTSNGTSLNDYLLCGPKLQNDLAAVILKWRQFRYVFSADIAKMYRQILIDPRDCDYQRILWRASFDVPVEEYRLLTVTYGTTSAPFLALRVLRQLAIDEGSNFPLALPVLQHQIYVDDCLFGADDRVLACQTREQLISLLAKGGFHLRKWASNCSTLLEGIDPSNHGLACGKDLQRH